MKQSKNQRSSAWQHDPRQRMLDETSAWLSWAIRNRVEVPRIPRRRVDLGGFTKIINNPGARAAAKQFWVRTFAALDSLKP